MSQDWYLINPPHQQLSGYEFDYLSNFGSDSFAELLDSYIAEDVEIYNTELSDYIITKSIVNDKVNSSSLTKFTLSLLLPLDVNCNTGMYIRYKDNYWIITSNVNNNHIYKKLNAELCTYTLKFQHPQTGAILSYPCITSNRIQGVGEKETNIMTLPAGNKVVLLPFDENTILLTNDKRLYLDNHPIKPRPYKITFVDSTSKVINGRGLLELYAAEDQNIHENDRPDLGICDYFEPTISNPYVKIISYGNLNVGTTNIIDVEFYDSDGNLINNINAIWNVELPEGYENYFNISYDGNLLSITIKENYKLLGKSVHIQVSDENGECKDEINLLISI